MAPVRYIIFIITVSCCVSLSLCSRSFELSDNFSEIRKNSGIWLVKFYAPWCGHCKRLEPIWNHVAQSLAKTHIRVGRVDCSRFTSVAAEFRVNTYPTIKLIKPDVDFTFHGDRTREDIVNFALRMAGPPVQDVTSPDVLNNMKQTNQLFFMYVGDKEGHLWEAYYDTARLLQPHSFFFSASEKMAKPFVEIYELPAVFVYKESLHHFYSVESGSDDYGAEHLNISMYKWINEERFETFPKITRGNINEILQTKKYLVLAVVEENKLQQIPAEMLEFRDMVESVIRKRKEKYHKNFQFGWIGTPDLANSIAMQILPLPYLLVLNSTTNHHYMPEDDPTQLTEDALEIFLERIYNRSVPVYGGNSLPVRLYRVFFEAKTSLSEMWRGNPVLTTVIFGLPMGFFTLILYSICCADILDADEDEDEDLHEKAE